MNRSVPGRQSQASFVRRSRAARRRPQHTANGLTHPRRRGWARSRAGPALSRGRVVGLGVATADVQMRVGQPSLLRSSPSPRSLDVVLTLAARPTAPRSAAVSTSIRTPRCSRGRPALPLRLTTYPRLLISGTSAPSSTFSKSRSASERRPHPAGPSQARGWHGVAESRQGEPAGARRRSGVDRRGRTCPEASSRSTRADRRCYRPEPSGALRLLRDLTSTHSIRSVRVVIRMRITSQRRTPASAPSRRRPLGGRRPVPRSCRRDRPDDADRPSAPRG